MNSKSEQNYFMLYEKKNITIIITITTPLTIKTIHFRFLTKHTEARFIIGDLYSSNAGHFTPPVGL